MPNRRRASVWVSTTVPGCDKRAARIALDERELQDVEEQVVDEQTSSVGSASPPRMITGALDQRVDARSTCGKSRLEPLPGDVGGHLEMTFLAGLLGSR